MYISEAVEGYKIDKQASFYSINTLIGYQTHFNQLIGFLWDVELSSVSSDDLKRFFIFLRNDYVPKRFSGNKEPLRTTTLRNAWCAVRSLFTWAERDLKITRPDLDLKRLDVNYPEIVPFTTGEIASLLKACEYSKPSKTIRRKSFVMKRQTGKRDRAMILFLLDTGVRVSELIRLKIKDINIENGSAEIIPEGSGRKSRGRTVYIGSTTKKALWLYLNHISKDNYVFMSIDHRSMTRNAIRQLLSKLGKAVGIAGVHPHRFRHTFAIKYLRNGGDVFTLQRLLGHSTLEMVRYYLLIAKADVQNTYKSASPVDRWGL